MDIEVTSGVMATLRAQAAKTAPQECCGLLLGCEGRVLEARAVHNIAEDPLTRFEIDPAALLAAHKAARDGGPQIVGYYHSHPTGHPVPSATDCEHASGDSRIWAIIAGDNVKFWRDGEGGFEEVTWRAAAGQTGT